MLYQALTTNDIQPGKENSKVLSLKFPFCAFAPLLLKNHLFWFHFQLFSFSAFQLLRGLQHRNSISDIKVSEL